MSVSSSQTSPSTPLPGTQLPGLGRRFSVRLRLLLFVVGSGLLILGVSSLLIFTTAESNAIEEVKTYAQEIASTRALEMNERFARLSQTARAAAAAETALATQPGDRHLEQVRQTLAEIAKRQLDFLNIYVFYDKQVIPGHDYAAVWETRDESKSDLPTQPTKPFYPNLPGDSHFDPSQPTYDYYINTPRFELARTLKVYQSAWTDVFRDVDGRPGKVYVIAGIAPIVDAQDKFVGMAGVDLQFGKIRTYIAAVKPTENAYAMLLDRSGILIAHAKDTQLNVLDRSVSDVATEYHSDSMQQLGAQMQAGRKGVLEMVDPLTNESVFAAYAPIEEVGWSVAVMIPRADLLGGAEQLRTTITLIALGALLIFALSGLLLGEAVVRPLVHLTATAEQVAAGDLQQVAIVERNDEVGTLATTFNAMTTRIRDLINSLELRVELRTAQLQASADVGRVATSILDSDQLLHQVVNLIAARFGFYYVAAFTLDETGKWAILREATGTPGQVLKEHGHKLEVGGQSMVGAAMTQRRAHIALDVGAEAIRFANPLLPDTRSEIALPLIVGERVIGALDVQSSQPAAFDEASTAVLQAMTDQIAVALNNAGQYGREQTRAEQIAKLLEGSIELTTQTDRASLYDKINRLAMQLLDADGASLWLPVESDQIELVTTIDVVGPPSTVGRRLRAGESLTGQVFATGAVIRVDDYQTWSGQTNAFADASIRASMGVPMIWQGKVAGVLALTQSQPGKVFTADDESTARLLATQAAAAIANLALLEQQQRTLHELNTANRRLTREAWQTFTRSQTLSYEYRRSSFAVPEEPGLKLNVPLELRGQTIGAITIEDRQSDRVLNEDERGLVQGIVQQVTLALENQRLTEVAQQAAYRDRAIAEAADRIHRPTEIDEVLQAAMEEIGRVGYAAPAHVTWTSSEDGVTLAAPRAGDGSQTAGEDAALLSEPIIVQRRSNGDGSDNAVTLPIVLRDQLFGALRFHVPADTWNSNLEAILIGIAGHVAQAIENARLIEQTRRAAQREKDIAAAADKIHRPSEIDAIMRTAIEELSRITGTPDVSIRLGVGDSSNGDGRGE